MPYFGGGGDVCISLKKMNFFQHVRITLWPRSPAPIPSSRDSQSHHWPVLSPQRSGRDGGEVVWAEVARAQQRLDRRLDDALDAQRGGGVHESDYIRSIPAESPFANMSVIFVNI